MNSTVLFIGPSLSPVEAARLLQAPVDIMPPIRRGDLDALDPDITRVAIVDGVFFTEQAVSPREILTTLRRGVEVLGSSSMGALRAAELSPYGMRGIGEVYRRYAAGELDSDADVALIFDPETGMALTEPRVNVRQMITLAEQAGVLTAQQAASILQVVLALHYVDLTYSAVVQDSAGVLPRLDWDRWAAFVSSHQLEADLKRSDALQMVGVLNAACCPVGRSA
jgi:hypothetical protein